MPIPDAFFAAKAIERSPHGSIGMGDRFHATSLVVGASRGAWTSMLTLGTVPRPLTPFIGRDRAVETVARLLEQPGTRHVSICGPGGIGKTRLALHVTELIGRRFDDGVAFVELGSLSDAGRVADAIALNCGVTITPGQPTIESLAAHFRGCHALLVLDNFEHVLAAADVVPRLLQASSDLVVLATSREQLGTPGEHIYELEPLSLPPHDQALTIDAALRSEAIQLFVAHARQASTSFELADDNLQDLVTICRRLDGLPLALELAAAQPSLLPFRRVLVTQDRVLPFLRGGPGRPERHRTMRDAIAWSVASLTPLEHLVFVRLAAYPAGCNLGAAHVLVTERVENQPSDARDLSTVMSILDALLGKHLLRTRNDGTADPRFTMLETVREFALDELDRLGIVADTRARLVKHLFALASNTPGGLRGPHPELTVAAMDRELDNLRSALDWLRREGPCEGITLLSFANQLSHYWLWKGLRDEAIEWLNAGVSQYRDKGWGSPVNLASAHLYLGHLEDRQPHVAAEHYRQSLALFEELGIERAIAGLTNCLGVIAEQLADFVEAKERFTRSLGIAESIGDLSGIALASYNLGKLSGRAGEFDRAIALLSEARRLWEAADDATNVTYAVAALGQLARQEGRLQEAGDLLHWSRTRLEQTGIRHGLGMVHYELGMVALAEGNLDLARLEMSRSLRAGEEAGERDAYRGASVEALAEIAVRQQKWDRAIELIAAAETWRRTTSYALSPAEAKARDRTVASARRNLDERAFRRAWARGGLLEISQAAQLPSDLPSTEGVSTAPRIDHPLTPSELKVVCLLSSGLTNDEIALQLGVATRTVTTHLTSAFSKLGVPNRTRAAALAQHHGWCEGIAPQPGTNRAA